MGLSCAQVHFVTLARCAGALLILFISPPANPRSEYAALNPQESLAPILQAPALTAIDGRAFAPGEATCAVRYLFESMPVGCVQTLAPAPNVSFAGVVGIHLVE